MAAKSGADEDDCFGAAQIGLLEAIAKFDPNRGCKFSTIAGYYIVAAIQEYALPHKSAISIPTYMTRHGKAKYCENRAKAKVASAVRSLSARIDGGDSRPLSDIIADPKAAASTSEDQAAAELAASVREIREAIRGLPTAERRVMQVLYPDGRPPLTLSEAARSLGISREWVRQHRIRAVDMIRLGFGLPRTATA
jgi:RNA polymerase sigma factor (sigma-70 family)